MKNMPKHQQGVALITILIMIALATILAASIAKKQRFTAEATQSFLRQNQAMQYAQSGESFFAELLADDAKNADSIDHLGETWAQPMPAYPVEDGFVTGQLQDAARKFNINNLLNLQGEVDEAAKAVFVQILKHQNIPEQQVEAVIDWMDADDETVGPMGAEQSFYRGSQGGYIPANAPLETIDELKLIRGFEAKVFYQLLPYLTALPRGAKININTASAEMLAALAPQANVMLLETELKNRRDNGQYFNGVDDLFTVDGFVQLEPEYKEKLKSQLDVRSSYYDAYIRVELSQRQRILYSRLVRQNDTTVALLSREILPVYSQRF